MYRKFILVQRYFESLAKIFKLKFCKVEFVKIILKALGLIIETCNALKVH